MEISIEHKAFSPDSRLSGVLGIPRAVERGDFHCDPGLPRKLLTAPGGTTSVAVEKDNGEGVLGLRRLGAARMDPTSSDEARPLCLTFPRREQTGSRHSPSSENNGRPD